MIIKDIEDVARTPTGLGMNQNGSANPGGGHPEIVEGVSLRYFQNFLYYGVKQWVYLMLCNFKCQAYAWGFDIRNWQKHLNQSTWPEIFRQLALSAGFGPQLKKRSIAWSYANDKDEVHYLYLI